MFRHVFSATLSAQRRVLFLGSWETGMHVIERLVISYMLF